MRNAHVYGRKPVIEPKKPMGWFHSLSLQRVRSPYSVYLDYDDVWYL